MMIRFLLLFSIFSLIQSCSVSPYQTPVTSEHSSTDKSALANPETISKPFEAETLYSLLVAEMAGSRGQYKVTLGNYIRQAQKTQDIGIIARAARIAQFIGVHQSALEMGLLWLKYDPNNQEANTIVATRLVAVGQLVDALSYAKKHNNDEHRT